METMETTAPTVPETTPETPRAPTVQETVPETQAPTVPETTEITLEQLRDDLVHTNLYGSFLICGTLVGIALCWRFLK